MPDRDADEEPLPEPLADTAAAAAPAPDRLSSIASGLVLVSTPIGNLADISPRALAALRNSDLVLCEDTRTTARLLRHYGIAAGLSIYVHQPTQAQVRQPDASVSRCSAISRRRP